MEKITYSQNCILIDWLTVVMHDVTVDQVKQMLGLAGSNIPWDDRLRFINGYPRSCSWHNVNIRYGADDIENFTGVTAADKVRFDMGICLDISGSGCRAFESYSQVGWIPLLMAISSLPGKVHFTRLDLAYDDHSGLLDLDRIEEDTRKRYFTGSPKKSKIVWSDDQETDVQGCTVYIGSEGSAVHLRIYDKTAERVAALSKEDKRKIDKQELVHWVRVELVLRDDRSHAAVDQIIGYDSPGIVFCGVLRNYCCFREPTGDSNKSRWPVADYWDQLLESVDRIRLWASPGEPYDMLKVREHFVNQWGQYLQLMDRLGMLPDILRQARQRHPELNPKYQQCYDQYRADQLAYAKKMRAQRDFWGIPDEWLSDGQIDLVGYLDDLDS